MEEDHRPSLTRAAKGRDLYDGEKHWSSEEFTLGRSGSGSKRRTARCHADFCLFPARDDGEGGVEMFGLSLDRHLVFTKVVWNRRSVG